MMKAYTTTNNSKFNYSANLSSSFSKHPSSRPSVYPEELRLKTTGLQPNILKNVVTKYILMNNVLLAEIHKCTDSSIYDVNNYASRAHYSRTIYKTLSRPIKTLINLIERTDYNSFSEEFKNKYKSFEEYLQDEYAKPNSVVKVVKYLEFNKTNTSEYLTDKNVYLLNDNGLSILAKNINNLRDLYNKQLFSDIDRRYIFTCMKIQKLYKENDPYGGNNNNNTNSLTFDQLIG